VDGPDNRWPDELHRAGLRFRAILSLAQVEQPKIPACHQEFFGYSIRLPSRRMAGSNIRLGSDDSGNGLKTHLER
jgi:hypothetical protein